MTPFESDEQALEAAAAAEAAESDTGEQFPAWRLLAHDADDSWLDDEHDGWRPID